MVLINGQESRWYVEKDGFGWYNIQFYYNGEFLSFRKQSWFSSQDKAEIKEKLQECVTKKIEIETGRQGIKYAYQAG